MINFASGVAVSALIGLLLMHVAEEPKIIGVTAQCHSGYYTTAIGRGACSGHGGIKKRVDR
jgi:hypothetical protein